MVVRTGRPLGELGGCQIRDRCAQAVRGELAGQPAYLADELVFVVDVDSPASASELAALLEAGDRVAEIPKSIRAGAAVKRVSA